MLAPALLNAISGLIYARVLLEGCPDRGRAGAGAGLMAALALDPLRPRARRLREPENPVVRGQYAGSTRAVSLGCRTRIRSTFV